jgi:hypothetical protein
MAGSTTLMLGAGTTIANAITLSGAATIGLVPVVLNVDYMLVGGGGGGGWAASYSAGGGGGGQVLQGSVQLSLVNPLAVVVGAGGAGASSKVAGGTGSSSTFNGFSAAGGGGGGDGVEFVGADEGGGCATGEGDDFEAGGGFVDVAVFGLDGGAGFDGLEDEVHEIFPGDGAWWHFGN